MNKEIEKLQEIIDDSENIVFFGGAGVSTESNIPDFRSADGLFFVICLIPRCKAAIGCVEPMD